MWKARAVQWQNAGINVETVAPKEGVPMYVSGFVMPKNAPNKDGAYAYSTPCWRRRRRRTSPSTWATTRPSPTPRCAPDLQKRIGFTDEEQKRLVDLDYGYMAKNDAAFKEWWNKSFKG